MVRLWYMVQLTLKVEFSLVLFTAERTTFEMTILLRTHDS